MCCTCAGSCNHVGNHSYCEAHGGVPVPPSFVSSSAGPILPFPSTEWTCVACEAKDEIIDALTDEVNDLRRRLDGWEFFVRARIYGDRDPSQQSTDNAAATA